MFSKPLFKQSCKANGLMWTIITGAICFMLAALMLICGNGNIAGLKSQLSDAIIQEEINSQINVRSMNFYNLSNLGVDKFKNEYQNNYSVWYGQYLGQGYTDEVASQKAGQTAYTLSLLALQQYSITYAQEKGYAENSLETKEITAGMMFAFAPNNESKEIYNSHSETFLSPEQIVALIITPNNENAIQEHLQNTTTIFIAYQITSKSNIDLMLEALKEFNISKEKFNSFGLTYESVKKSSNQIIVEFEARKQYEIGLIMTDTEIEDKSGAIQLMIENLTKDLSASLLSNLPKDVADGLQEIGKMDLFSMVIGSIFYKIAGLLLPIIYIIMVSNNLISSQIDTGSMAYVLSTSTKRKQVIFTQGLFLIGSLFVMCACLTVTSMICMSFVDLKTALGYKELLLLNLGTFVTLFAISGLCFLTSCWFDRSKRSMAIGGGLSIFFLVATMLGLFGTSLLPSVIRLDSLNFFNYLSIISLFDTLSIASGTCVFIWKFIILIIFGVVGYIVGGIKFKKKDLPL